LEADVATELMDAFRFLWVVRLQHQAAQVDDGVAPDDFVDPTSLGTIDRRGLKEAFRVIRGAQQVLSLERGIRM
jgi:CBS domain-containing protein